MTDQYYNPKWKAPFPKRNPDMTFQVILKMKFESDEDNNLIKDKIQVWIDEVWMPKNLFWEGVVYKADGSKCDKIDEYHKDFSAPPTVLSCDNREIQILLKGQPTDYYWKDWVVYKIMPDLKKEFPEVGDFVSLKDYDEI